AGFVAGLLQDVAAGGLIGVQALTKALVGFGLGAAGGRLRVTQPLVQIPGVVTLGLLAIIGQLWYLQVLEGGRFLDASDKNRIRIRPIAAPRGILFDRNGVPLVDNRPAFTLSIISRELDNRDAVLGRLATLLGLPY